MNSDATMSNKMSDMSKKRAERDERDEREINDDTPKRLACSLKQEEDEEETSCCGECGTEYNIKQEVACGNRMDACYDHYIQNFPQNRKLYKTLLEKYNNSNK